MAEDTGLDLESLDIADTDTPAAPDPAPAADPAPSAPPAAAAEPTAQPRDPATGQFAAAASAAPAPAAPAPAAAAPPVVDPSANRVIPLAAHLAERNRWQQRIEEGDRKLADLNTRIAKLEPQTPTPDFVEDPKGYVDATARQTQQELATLRAEAEQLQGQQQMARFLQDVGSQEAAFIEKNSDYYDALNHVRTIRSQQLGLMYPTATPEAILQAMRQEELQSAYVFMQQGRSPAECAYQMAQQMGYHKAAAPAAPAVPAAAPKGPDIPRAPVADPSNTLGPSGVDPEGDGELVDDGMSALNEALSERFGTRG